MFSPVYLDSHDFLVSIDPHLANEPHSTRTLFFAAMAFLSDRDSLYDKATDRLTDAIGSDAVKAVIWDLDGTLWHETLIENGIENVRPNQVLLDAVRHLDSVGIVQSIASKNDFDQAVSVLTELGVFEYFIFAKANWRPKSQNVVDIVRALNVDENSVLFVDDSAFERAEVQSMLPRIRCVHPSQMESYASMDILNPAVSTEATQRRHSYKAEERRQHDSSRLADFQVFLKQCMLDLTISTMSEEALDRAYELVTRTHQLNFSGTILSRAELLDVSRSDETSVFLARCKDKYGDYGTIGIATFVAESGVSRVSNFALSCRVQSKMIEHYFLKWIFDLAARSGHSVLHVTYVQTKRNSPAGSVFDDLNAVRCDQHDNCFLLKNNSFLCLPQDLIVVDYAQLPKQV
ncbi:HAD-IIIC family phosphatase [Novipirellula sp. SH528]|uniref:HAD-IIIC family phosphatase n=1 Tax=Novipirellula sp. SH528 TaxID=3454466 RepID=UPI003FA0559E